MELEENWKRRENRNKEQCLNMYSKEEHNDETGKVWTKEIYYTMKNSTSVAVRMRIVSKKERGTVGMKWVYKW
jgi:hypothetical protein